MTINRHNYEEFFLMYVDNELSAQDRASVESFVQENPDLATELQLLAQATLPVENMHFGAKETLIRQESIPTDIQEQMLLLLDHELDNEERNQLETGIENNKAWQSEWQTLQLTRLDAADAIIFPDKQSLYKHSTGKLISVRFWRMAAAAAILGFGLFTGISVLQNREQPDELVVNQKDQQKTSPITGRDVQPTGSKDQQSPATPTTNDPVVNGQNIIDQATASISVPVQNSGSSNKKYSKDHQGNSVAVSVGKAPGSKPPVSSEKNISEERNFSTARIVEQEKKALQNDIQSPVMIANVQKESTNKEIKTLSALDTDIMSPLTVPDVRVAALNAETEDNGENSVLFLNDEQVKKSKLNGMFRQLKRTIERNTKIKPGKSIKIAGFEIAAR